MLAVMFHIYTVKFRQTINKVNEAERLGECGFRKGLNKSGKEGEVG